MTTSPPMLQSVLAQREGFHVPGAEAFELPTLIEMHLFGVDLSISRTILILFAATFLVGFLFWLGFRKPKLVPRGLQNVMEYGVDFIRNNIIMPVMGPSGMSYLPFFTTMFFFILFCNWFSVVPGVNFPPTSRIAIPIVLALTTWIVFVSAGIRSQGGWTYFRNTVAPPGVPTPVLFILTPVEFLSTFILRPITLALRLTANLIAGHVLLTVFFLGTAYLLGRGLTAGFGVASGVMSVALVGFEMFVGALQAFIFTILTAVYIQSSKQAH